MKRARPSTPSDTEPKPIGESHPSAGVVLFTLPEAADQMRISRTKLYQLVRQQKIVHYRIGGSIRFSTKQMEDFLGSCIDGPINPFAGQKREFL